MTSPSSSRFLPLILVIGFGLLMGLIPVLVKLAAENAVSPSLFAIVQASGAGLAILALCRILGHRLSLDRRSMRYYAIAGLSGIALPNELLFLSVPHLGAGLIAILYCFPPLITLCMALAIGMERLNPWRAGGILLGLAASLAITLPKGNLNADPFWLAIAMSAPLSLAFGNIYRSRSWPPGAKPLPLAAGMLLAGALWLLPVLLLTGLTGETGAPILFPTERGILLLAFVVAITAIGYVMFLTLQQIAGAVYMSQVGYVITATGLAIGVGFLGEQYGPWIWVAVALVFAAVALATIPGKAPPVRHSDPL